MKILITIWIGLISCTGFAQTILLQAPGSSSEKYAAFLQSHRESVSVTDFTLRKIQNNSVQENQLFQLSDTFSQNVSVALEKIKSIQSEAPLTMISLRYIRDLTEKSLALKPSQQERQELLHLYCKSAALLNEGPSAYPCPSKVVSLKLLKKKYPQLENIFVESFSFPADEKDSITMAPQTPYQWTLLSNVHRPVRFFGTFEQLLNQQLSFENWIDGTCDGFSSKDLDFDLAHRGIVYFSDDCQKKALPLEDKKSWVSENRHWLYAAGIAVAGGLIYAMKDKRLVINTSAFK